MANIYMEMIMRTCSAMKAAYNESNCQKEGTTHSKIGLFVFSGVVLSASLAHTSLSLFFCVSLNILRSFFKVSFDEF